MIAGCSNSIMHYTETDEARAKMCVTEEMFLKNFYNVTKKTPSTELLFNKVLLTCSLQLYYKKGKSHVFFRFPMDDGYSGFVKHL